MNRKRKCLRRFFVFSSETSVGFGRFPVFLYKYCRKTAEGTGEKYRTGKKRVRYCQPKNRPDRKRLVAVGKKMTENNFSVMVHNTGKVLSISYTCIRYMNVRFLLLLFLTGMSTVRYLVIYRQFRFDISIRYK